MAAGKLNDRGNKRIKLSIPTTVPKVGRTATGGFVEHFEWSEAYIDKSKQDTGEAAERIRGCGKHRWKRDISGAVCGAATFDDYFYYDCVKCCSLLAKNPKLCDTCQKWNFADLFFKRGFDGDIHDEPEKISAYQGRPNCMLCRVLLEASLEKSRAIADSDASMIPEIFVVNCGPYHFETRDDFDEILRERNGVARCLFLLLVSPDAWMYYAERLRVNRMRVALTDKGFDGQGEEGSDWTWRRVLSPGTRLRPGSSSSEWKAWEDDFLSVHVEMRFNILGHGLLDVRPWGKSVLDVQHLRSLVETNEVPPTQLVGGGLPANFRLIDTSEKRIFRPESAVRFAALSYVWSSSAGQKCEDLTKERLDRMAQVDGLKEENYPCKIWDAIRLCQHLGVQYLWTDRLCIIQDDEEDLQLQVLHMDRIYGHAAFTIASIVDHRLDMGLPGAPGRPRRDIQYNIADRFDGNGPRVDPNLDNLLERSEWNTRGWTLQERILSRQCVFISNFNWFFISGSILYHEDFGKLDDYFARTDYVAGRNNINDTNGIVSNAREYILLADHYTKRKLSFQSDVLRAFAGISSVVSNQLQTRHIFGLFERFIDSGLLWGYKDTAGLTQDENKIPSWSWAAWQGNADYFSLFRGYLPDGAELGPLLTYYYSHPTEGVVMLQPEKKWFRYSYTEPAPSDSQIANTWTTNSKRNFGPEDNVSEWRACMHNPWTMIDHQELDPDNLDPTTRFPGSLVFNTTVTTLSLVRIHKVSISFGAEDVFFILDPRGQKIGYLMRFTSRVWTDVWFDPKTEYRFVVLSAGLSPSSSQRMSEFEDSPYVQLFQADQLGRTAFILNVMLVEQDLEFSQVHRRIAIGIILMKHYTACNPKWETIILT